MKTIRLIFESFRFALSALRSNLLRTILSLLGVTVGIFTVILVFSVVDSLEAGVRQSLSFVGDKVVYVQKWPWSFSPDYPWWKYINRPQPVYEEYEFLQDKLQNARAVSIQAGRRTIAKWGSNSSDIYFNGISYDHKDVADIPVNTGRYFTQIEEQTGQSVAVIGFKVADELFATKDPIGKEISVKGRRFRVIGVMKEVGENLLDAPSNDQNVFIPYKAFQKVFYSGKYEGVGSSIAIKGTEQEGPQLETLEAEVRGLMRQRRGLRPREEDNFALNKPQMLADFVSSIFAAISIVGAIIGSFAILIGGFGIANIMFVSVRERTNQIGVQKSLGAKNYFILLQFLFEAIFLSLLGGIAGLVLVFVIISLAPLVFEMGTFNLILTTGNVIVGLLVAAIVGVISGLWPAWSAARMDPVTAIRTT
ncbi:ABC transporter permease [Cesiribacter sp. SM1]|uniref:ABC transporter permease n=1 Tax=Cesiribacter sp. SM1 TaxID=2861196 RepID=UPI001CD6F245